MYTSFVYFTNKNIYKPYHLFSTILTLLSLLVPFQIV